MFSKSKPAISMVELSGTITTGNRPGRLNLERYGKAIRDAFNADPDCVVLKINSPGGSPVQAAMVNECIRYHAKRTGIPVYAYCEDVAASGGYMIAMAADHICANRFSVVGSIGVIHASFGFHELMNNIGVERRVITEGTNKAPVDPFRKLDDEGEAYIKRMLKPIYNEFVAMVMEARGNKLQLAHRDDLFSGKTWNATEAVELGLIDEVSSLEVFLRTLAKTDDYRLKTFGAPKGGGLMRFLGAKVGLMKDEAPTDISADVAAHLADELEARLRQPNSYTFS